MPNQMSISQRPCVVACLGSSSTAGKGQAFNWVAEIQQRLPETRYVIRNFGVGGDLTYNALQRLSAVIACQPHKIIVFVGGNDVLALVSRKARRFFRIFKRLPCEPSPAWLRKNLEVWYVAAKPRLRRISHSARCLPSEKIQRRLTTFKVSSIGVWRSSATLSEASLSTRTLAPSLCMRQYWRKSMNRRGAPLSNFAFFCSIAMPFAR